MLAMMSCGYVLGVLSQLAWVVVPSKPLLTASAVPVLLAFVLLRRGGQHRLHPAVIPAVVGLVIGIASATWHAESVLQARLPADLAGSDHVVDAQVVSLQQYADGGQLFRLRIDALPWRPGLRSPFGWQLRVATREAIAALPGERWRMTVRLKPPRAAQNPGSGDFERYLFGERVVASGYLRDDGEFRRIAGASGWAALRLGLLEHALPLLGDGPGDLATGDDERFARAVLPALVLDERSLLSSPQWRVLADTGTAHLVAISGLHVALLWGALLWVGSLLLRRRADALKYRAASVLPALVVAWGYAALAGMPLPALRATIMLAVASVFLLFAAQVPVWRVWLASVAAVLVLDPLSVHASGFWLSFGAVALLLFLNDLRLRAASRVRHRHAAIAVAVTALRMQATLSLLLAPMLVALFGAASVSSVVANMPAIPLVNLLALPAALAGFCLAPIAPVIADPLLALAESVLALLWTLLVWIDDIRLWSPLQAFGAGTVSLAVAMLALPVVVCARQWSLRAAVLAMMFLAWPIAPPVATGKARACVLDVGQGLAVFVKTARHALLYDAGPVWGERDAGASVVVPAVRALGAGGLDLLVVSHDDVDHAGGLASVLDALPTRELVAGDARTLQGVAHPGMLCDQRRDWRYDGVRITVFPGDAAGNDNDRSCVLRVDATGRALLVPGDSSVRRELSLLEAWGALLAADVLVAGHHGSRSSSSLTFLYRIAPEAVVFSAAHRSRFGHPHPAVVERVAGLGASSHITGEEGAVCFDLDAQTPPLLRGWRYQNQRYWRGPERSGDSGRGMPLW
jgi:competence protein ComEC